jgi:hypothetical protein
MQGIGLFRVLVDHPVVQRAGLVQFSRAMKRKRVRQGCHASFRSIRKRRPENTALTLEQLKH